jgi:exonuclease SbcC
VIDAITFALYGAVPRLDQRSVEPVITKGKQEARVRLDFSIGDQTYTAVRVVRRMGADRASTKEARLEHGDTVVAGDADGVTEAVARLLGLRFEEFTRCVVLPQGEFARFLNDKPNARGDLLVRLLDLQVYERLGQRANQRASAAEATVEVQRTRLSEDLSFATSEAFAEMRDRIERLEAVRARIEADETRLEELREGYKAERAAAEAAGGAIATLAGIRAPADLDGIGRGLSAARDDLAASDAALEAAGTAVEAAQKALEALPDRGPLLSALDAHDRKQRATTDLAAADAAGETLAAEASAAARATAEALESESAARAGHEAARVAHSAADIARSLVAGHACPVCGQDVHEMPHVEVPADLEATERALATATAATEAARAIQAKAERASSAANARGQALRETIAAIDEAVAAHPEPAAIRTQLAAIDHAEATRKGASENETAARAHVAKARAAYEREERAVKDAWVALEAARDAVAAQGPPAPAREDLIADWRVLLEWAAERIQRLRADGAAAEARAAAAKQQGADLVEAQRLACVAAGIEDAHDPRDDCLKALQSAKDQAERIEIALQRAEELRAEIAALEERAVVSNALGRHLRANAFERWVLSQALTALVEGATEILLELSGGLYSLDLDKHANFAVVDHRNADARRSSKTLSGGETFLASLALALAMSDRIAQLSANTAVRLESIFLDEGFGTLDPETLEVVRAAIENLAARNRTVGIVTHVRSLAEEIPVRFEVRKGPHTSTIEKVLA